MKETRLHLLHIRDALAPMTGPPQERFLRKYSRQRRTSS